MKVVSGRPWESLKAGQCRLARCLCIAVVIAGCLPAVRAAAAGMPAPLLWQSPQLVDARASSNVAGLDAAGCYEAGLCVTAGGPDVVVSSDPVGGAQSWRRANIDGALMGTPSAVACPARSLCVGVRGNQVVASSHPTGGASAWTRSTIDASGLSSVSCSTGSFCVAVAEEGTVAISTSPTDGPDAWRTFQVATTKPEGCGKYGVNLDCLATLTGVSCPSVSLCVAVDSADGAVGDVITSTDPGGRTGEWKAATLDHSIGLTSVSCPTASLCVAIAGDGGLFTSTDPTGGASAWRRTTFRWPRNDSESVPQVSCGSPSLCVVTGGDHVFMSSDPTGGASAWSSMAVDPTVSGVFPHSPSALLAVSCTPAHLCLASDSTGHIVVGIAAAPIVASVAKQLTPPPRAARAWLLTTGAYRLSFRASRTGQFSVSWQTTVKGERIVVAEGRGVVFRSHPASVTIRLTAAGRRELEARARVSITATGRFTPTGWSTAIATRTFTLGVSETARRHVPK
jgi:hypothetical protein